MRIWTAIFVLASSCLISGVKASEPINPTSVLVEKTTVLSQSTNGKQISVSKAEFGLKRVDFRGKTNVIPTTRVPLREGNIYGWRIQLKDYQSEVKWREVLRLPKPPETWGTDNGEDFSISRDGTTAQTKRIQSAEDGVIENFWTIAPGDPLGKYKIEVYIDDRLIGSFEFELVSVLENRR
jgi:hypothetical protein